MTGVWACWVSRNDGGFWTCASGVSNEGVEKQYYIRHSDPTVPEKWNTSVILTRQC